MIIKKHSSALIARLAGCLVAAFALLTAQPAFAQWSAALGPSVRHFTLSEYNRGGERIVREQGWMPGIEARLSYGKDRWTWFGEIQYYKRGISYDGQTQTGIPFDTATDTALLYPKIGVSYALTDRLSLQAAIEREKWKRDIRGRGETLGLNERSDSDRLLLGIETNWHDARLGKFTAGGSAVFSKAEKLRVSFAEGYDDARTETKPATGLRLGLSLRPQRWPATELRSEFDYIKVDRSDRFALTSQGQLASSANQPEHRKQSFTLSLRYHF